jgi:hypothetical protein
MLHVNARPQNRFSVLVNRDAVAELGRAVRLRLRLIEPEAEPIESLPPVTGIAIGRDRDIALAKARVRWLGLVEQLYGEAAANLARARFQSVQIEQDGAGFLCLFRATPTEG